MNSGLRLCKSSYPTKTFLKATTVTKGTNTMQGSLAKH